MKYYLKKPIPIPMVKWEDDEASYMQLLELGAKPYVSVRADGTLDLTVNGMTFPHRCQIGDYIAKGVLGDFYIIAGETQEKSYDEVDPSEVIGGG